MLQRIYDVDALARPCGGRLRFIALVTDRETARVVLEGHGLSADPPPIARARAASLLDAPAEPSSDPYAVAPPDDWFDPDPPECFDLPPPDT